MKQCWFVLLMSLAFVVGVVGFAQVTVTRAAPNATCTSAGSGNWSTITWTGCASGPTNSDTVVIRDGVTVTIDTNPTVAGLVIGEGLSGVLQFENITTTRTLTVTGNIVIANGGTFQVGTQSTSPVLHQVVIGGNLSIGNNATFNMTAPASPTIRRAQVTFNSSSVSDVTVSSSGTPALVRFMEIILNRGQSDRKVVCSVTSELGSGGVGITNGITYTSGTWEQSAGTFTFRGSNDQSLPATGTGNLTISGTGSVVFGSSVIVNGGTFTVNTTGTVTIGGTSNRLEPAGGTIVLTAGTINIGGRLGAINGTGIGDTGTLIINGGTINVPAGSLSNGSNSVFAIGSGMTFTMSTGLLNILTANQGATFAGNDVDIRRGVISGGSIVLGSASPGTQDFLVRSDIPLYDLKINASGRSVVAQTTPLTLTGSLAIESGTLNTNNLNLGIAGNWLNNGTFTAGTSTVTFNGTAEQTIGGSSSTGFANLIINGSARVVFPSTNTPTVTNTMMVNTGAILTQTATVNSGIFNFLTISTDKFRGVDVSSTNDLGAVTVTLKVAASGGCTTAAGSPAYATRCYNITPTNNNTATVTLWALDTERNNIAVADLAPYHYTGGSWVKLTNIITGTDGGSYVRATGDTPSFSAFLLGDTNSPPTAITLTTFSGRTPANQGWIVLILLAAAGLLISGWALRRRSPL